MPPWWLRRPLSITAWLILSTVCVLLWPVLAGIAQVIGALTGDRRLAIMTRIFLTYFGRELMTLVTCGFLWLLSGAGLFMRTGWMQALHWRLLRWFVGGIADATIGELGIQVREDASQEADRALADDGPLIVFSRHAGPGDTILLIDRLLTHFDRRPSVVFKEAIALDPSIDLIAHRLPHALLDLDDRAECEARIARTTRALGERGVLLLFPEGGNFTPERRRSALSSLRRRGRWEAVRRGEQLEHVLPPKPSGALTALASNPTAGVIFAAHTGLGLAAYPREIWRELPVGGTLYTRMWFVPRSEVPEDEDERSKWLNDWWQLIDNWIEGRHLE